jgi:virulence factor Mce-like protein
MSALGGKKASVGLGLAVAIAIGTVATTVSIFSLGSGNNDYQVKVRFATANGLIDGSDVFIGGVKVGTVASVAVSNTAPANNLDSSFANPTTSATATINIGRQYAPLHQGAKAAIRPKSLLGEKYVSVTVGDPSKDAIPDGSTLPPDAVSVNVELDQLINTFDEATRIQLQKLINNLGTGLAGQGRNTNETFHVGQTDLANFGQLTDVLATRDAELKRLIDALTKITQTLGSDQQTANYPDLLAHSEAVLKTLIAEEADVAQGTDRLDQFFAVLDAGFAGRQQDFQAVLGALPRTVSDLDALASTLGPQGHVALPIAQSAAPAVVASNLVFGATPAKNTTTNQYTYTNNVWARVMPSQGCADVNTRYSDASGFAYDAPPTTRPSSSNATEICTLPSMRKSYGTYPCDNYALGSSYLLGCTGTLTGSLCVAFGFNSQSDGYTRGCNGPAAAIGGPSSLLTALANDPGTQRGALGLPLQLASADQGAVNQLLGYLLR